MYMVCFIFITPHTTVPSLCLHSAGIQLFVKQFIQADNNKNFKALYQWIPLAKGQ